MSDNDDKYPAESGRRRFVKGVVGGSALAGVGATGTAAMNSITMSTGQGGGTTRAMAIENTAGPAPRGMPMIPIEIESNGDLRGVFPEWEEITEGGLTSQIARVEDFKGTGKQYSAEWFQYCGVQSYQGLSPDYEGDNLFRADSGTAYDWQSDAVSEGDPLNVSMFDDYGSYDTGIGAGGLGKPATGTWRSQDTESTMPIQVIRSPHIEELAQTGSTTVLGQTFEATGDIQSWIQAACPQGFIAWLNKCTHFCCVPGWKQLAGSATFNAENAVYCQCHQSVYQPFSVTETLFTALPRPQ
ncbi:ubiquinol-cytochrome c reductase iron-sulfur subunit [Halobium salinum]|uniref:Ubiquinol-cytochrome c reductase iron-sulfur subunit n=1 Tax=Halobium salinum TaxID=1364940 RepID=A0ABD5P9I1_9EURY|nr:ubiquinol-cytochrome c reductase iron-sulfur subunit [Halobium salinum]